MMVDKHKKFAESLRNIMRTADNKQKTNLHEKHDEDQDDSSASWRKIIDADFDALFASTDDN